MKRLLSGRKLHRVLRRTMAGLLTVAMIFVVLFPEGILGNAGVQLPGERAYAITTQDKIDRTEEQIGALEEQQAENEEEISGLKTEKKAWQVKLDDLNLQLQECNATLAELAVSIMDKTVEIGEAEDALTKAIAEEENQYSAMVYRIRAMYERKEESVLNTLLAKGSLGELLNAAIYYAAVHSYDLKKYEEYQENHRLIQEQKNRLELEKQELETLKSQQEEENTRVTELIGETQSIISDYAEDIRAAEQEALEYEKQLDSLNDDLEALKKQLEKEKEMSKKAANATWRSIGDVTFSDGDRKLLANLIYCEAGGEPYEGQVAVGAVVMNRVMSSCFPDTISEVIYAKGQFSPVKSGRLALALSVDKATQSCYNAADAAMSGATTVGNCVYFRTPIDGLEGISIGGHIFY